MLLGLIFCIVPLLAAILAGRKEKHSVVFFLAEYVFFALLIFGISVLVLLPTERLTIEFEFEEVLPRISSGKSAPIFAVGLALVLGEVAFRLKKIWQIERSIELNQKLKGKTSRRICSSVAVLLLLLLTSCYLWARRYYGNISFEEIIFHINMPLQGTADSFVRDILTGAIIPALAVFVLLSIWMYGPFAHAWWIRSQKKRFLWICIFPLKVPRPVMALSFVMWMLVLYYSADRDFLIKDFVLNQMQSSTFIEEHYVNPRNVQLTFPEKKRNLISIYLESAETSFQDIENGGSFDVNYIPEMTRIAKQNVSFSQSDKLEGAAVAPACGWTIAGLVAETAGLPLKLYRYEDGDGVDNSMDKYASFLPGATTLGDILKAEDYSTVFMAGSDITFAGKRKFFRQHGGYEILDYIEAKEQGVIPEDYKETWGFEDVKLYAWAKEVLTELAMKDRPFHFSMLTIDTHAPIGYQCELCPTEKYEHPYTNSLICSSRQLDAFLEWCKEQPFYKDTTIVVMGDHGSMVGYFYGSHHYERHAGDTQRKVYNAFINSPQVPVKSSHRRFTTLDFFPTTLASIGVEIEGDRLGLGTNLFSGRQTLSEEYGYEVLFHELNRKSVFYNEEILYP